MITIDITKAKVIAHKIRRVARSKVFQPLDIKATIPAEQVQAEQQRQLIRDSDTELQLQIDATTTIDELDALVRPSLSVVNGGGDV